MAWSEYPEQLPADEQARLFALMTSGTPQEAAAARDTLIATNLRLVAAVAGHYRNGSADPDDVFQAGVEGLIEAVDGHASARGPFGVFATIKIRQAIAGELRKSGFEVHVPRDRARLYHRINQTHRELRSEMTNREAIAATASHHQVPVSTGWEAIHARKGGVASLMPDEARGFVSMRFGAGSPVGDDIPGGGVSGSSWVSPAADNEAVASMTVEALYAGVRSLPATEAAIIAARLGLNDTDPMRLRDIADALGLARAEVSALESRALARLRHPSRAAKIGY